MIQGTYVKIGGHLKFGQPDAKTTRCISKGLNVNPGRINTTPFAQLNHSAASKKYTMS